MEVGGRLEVDYVPIATLLPQNDSCIKLGSDETLRAILMFKKL